MATIYRVGDLEVRADERRVLRQGRAVSLGARAFDLLLCLIEHRDRVVGKDEILAQVWPGVVVEDNNLTVQVSALRKLLGPDAIATVAGRGYRFAAPLAAALGDEAVPSPPADRPSIAVLPFTALSEDPSMRFLADGLVEDVIALLARVAGFLLISSSSSFAFRERRESLSAIAQRLDVRYVVEGSVRPMGAEVRVSTRLVEAASGRVLWSGSFDRKRDEAEDLQEAIARGIITELEPELTRAEIELIRRRRSDDVDAWGRFHQATAALAQKGWTDAALEEARGHLRLACEIDPAFALAHAQFALLTALGISTGLLEPSAAAIAESRQAADRALALDDQDSRVLGYTGCALADLGEHDRGADLLERALAIDPSNAQAHVALGATHALRGNYEVGIAAMRYGMRISPRDRRLAFWGWALGTFLLQAGRVDDALKEACTSATRDARLYLPHVLQALALHSLGRADEARSAYAAARRLRPAMTREDVARSHGEQAADRLGQLGA